MGEALHSVLPRQPGSYLLVLQLTRPEALVVGSLGRLPLGPGLYVYTGSARGPGGLRARLGRHLAGRGRCRWHVDYLRARAAPVAAAACVAPASLECTWARDLAALPGSEPVAGFGASDCRCAAHLVAVAGGFQTLRAGLDATVASRLSWFSPDGSAFLDEDPGRHHHAP